MDKLPQSRMCRALPGDQVAFRFDEESIVFIIPVKDIFPEYGELKRIFLEGVKGLEK